MTKSFDQGYACAVSCIVAGHGDGTEVREALKANGMTSVAALKRSDVSEYDIRILKPVIEGIRKDEKYRAAARMGNKR
jgi:hypothetical protein